MACDACRHPDTCPASTFAEIFEGFWPSSLPFPPMTPWLGAVVTRHQAQEWAVAAGAERRADLMAGDRQALLDFLGKAMLGDGMFAAERARRKRDRTPQRPDIANMCCENARSSCCDGALSCVFTCSPNADGSCDVYCNSTRGTDAPRVEGAAP